MFQNLLLNEKLQLLQPIIINYHWVNVQKRCLGQKFQLLTPFINKLHLKNILSPFFKQILNKICNCLLI